MKTRPPDLRLLVVLALGLALVFAPGFSQPAQAASEDVAIFYDELSQFGQWVDYENYGPVWYPSQVEGDWRPYTNGRWVPTEQGYVFETAEPWGWATYHYGNWMPSEQYGWVWVPGNTWYPSTVSWRTSPENAPVDTAYVGWAPTPPPNYVPPPAYYPPGGYTPGLSPVDLITAPFWIFANAARFLLGFGQPFVPGYSYMGCGCLAPPAYIPTFFPQTLFTPTFCAPTWYPSALIGVGLGAYAWGPPTPWITRWGGYNPVVFNKTVNINTVNITKITNINAPTTIINKNRYVRDITPEALRHGRPLPAVKPVSDVRLAHANLGKSIVHLPEKPPPLKAQIPKAPPVTPGMAKGAVGAGLPAKATQHLTPAMQAKIQKVPAHQKITPAAPLSAAKAPPGVKAPAAMPAVKAPIAPPGPPAVKAPAPGVKAPAAAPAAPGVKKEPGFVPPSGVKGPPPGVKKEPGFAVPPKVKGEKAVPLPPGLKGLTPEQKMQMEKQHQLLQKGKVAPQPKGPGPGFQAPGAAPSPKVTPTPKVAPKVTPTPPGAGPGFKTPTTGPAYKAPTAGPAYKAPGPSAPPKAAAPPRVTAPPKAAAPPKVTAPAPRAPAAAPAPKAAPPPKDKKVQQ